MFLASPSKSMEDMTYPIKIYFDKMDKAKIYMDLFLPLNYEKEPRMMGQRRDKHSISSSLPEKSHFICYM